MANCDICNAAMQVHEGTTYTIEDLQGLLACGFGPPDRVVQAAMAAGWTRERIVERWKQELDARPQPYWLLCPTCATRAAATMPGQAAPAAEAPEIALPEPPPEAAPLAEAPPPTEEPLPEEEAPPAKPPLEGRPPLARYFLLGLLFGLVAGIALGFFVRDRYLPLIEPTPTPTMTETPAPTATATPLPPTPTPTRTPTATPTPAFPAAVLAVDDLPEGFQDMPAGRQEMLGLNEAALAEALGDFAPARMWSFTALDNRGTGDLAVGFLLYPLTEKGQEALDEALDDPEAGLAPFWEALAQAGWSAPQALTNAAWLEEVGDSAAGWTLTGSDYAAGQRLDVVLVRRATALEVLVVGYRVGQSRPIDLEEVVRALDEQVETALGNGSL